MTEEGFRKYLRPYLEKSIPFSAYWHPKGFGLMRTGPVPTKRNEYILHVPGKPDKTYRDHGKCWNAKERTRGAWMETVVVDGKPRTISDTTIRRWWKNIEQLRRDSWDKVITVDFDGTSTVIEGGSFEL